MKHLALFICFFLPCLLAAQSDCDYDKLYREGKAFAKKRQYKMALYKFNSARRCDPSKGEPVDAAIEALLDQIEGEKRTADRERKRAEEALHQADIARQRSDSLYEVADAERRRAEAVLDKIYFFDDRFGLAYDKSTGRYGFIDKQLKTKIEFRYSEALPFDDTGYAKVKKIDGGPYYLIDTTGAEFLLATEVNQLALNVYALDLRGKRLSRIPDTVFSQIQLQVLLLNNNQLDTLPAESALWRMKNLRSLYLSDNNLSRLPAEIGQLNNLQSLNLSGNKLKTLPGEIGQLTCLRSLNLGFNPIFKLPTEINQLQNMQSFDFSGNKYYPQGELEGDMITESEFKLLERSQRLLREIGALNKLQLLDLSHNAINYLAFDIGQLTNLQWLNLSRNKLSSLPAKIRSLKSLKELYLQKNPFPPAYIEQLRKDMPWCEIQF